MMFEDEIQKLERKISRIEDHENLIVFYGSSSIRLWVKIEQDLAPLNVINLGFGGSSFDWMSHYYHRVFKDLHAVEVVLYGGDNDISNGSSALKIAHDFLKIKDQIESRYPQATIHGMTIKPSPAREPMLDKIKEANQLLKKAVTEGDKVRQINIFDPMLNDEGKANADLFMADQLHMNRKGYDIWTQVVRTYFGLETK
jgi:lysophospholipase L1-like esterase